MADIHVLTGAMRSKRKVQKNYAFHFAIPVVDQVAEAAQDPELVAFESAVPDIVQTELDDIKAGKIVEKEIYIPYNRDASAPAIAQKVRDEYANMQASVRIEYIERYREYLTTLTT